MNLLNLVNAIVLIIGIPSVITACIYVGRKLQILDSLCIDFKEFKNEIKSDLKDFKFDYSSAKEKVSILWDNRKNNFGEAHSPMHLKAEFKKIITDSDLDEQIKLRENDIVKLIQTENPLTPLDAQRVIDDKSAEILKWFNLTDFKNKLYEAGQTGGAEQFIFIIYLYEIIIPKLKFPEIKE